MPKHHTKQSHHYYHAATKIHETTLNNGLRLLVHERHALPIVTVMICYKVGAADLYCGKTGLAHFVEHMLFKGTKQFAKGRIDEITQDLGGSNNAYTTYDCTVYYFSFAREHWKKALEIEADRMCSCVWSEAEFNSEKDVILEELSSTLDTTTLFLMQESAAFFFKTHPYRHPITGWKQDLQSLTLDELYAYYRRYYLPNNAFMVVVGDVNAKEVAAEVASAFQHIPQGECPPDYDHTFIFPNAYRSMNLLHNTHTPQFALLFPTCPGGAKEEPALDILDITLATGKSSRLYRRFVEDERALQYITASNNTLRDPAIFWIRGELLPGSSPKQVEQGILEELENLIHQPISDYELQRAKNMIASGIIGCQATVYDTTENIVESEISGGGYQQISTQQKKLEQVTPKMVLSVARKYLHPKLATVVWLMPKNPTSFHLAGNPNSPTTTSDMLDEHHHQLQQLLFWENTTQSASFVGTHSPTPKLDFSVQDTYQKENAYHPQCTKLANGLTLIMFNNPTISEVLIRLHFQKVIGCDPVGREGAAHLLGEMLEKGTTQHTSQQINELVEFTGSGLTTNRNEIIMKVFEHDVEMALALMAEIAQFPQLDEQEMVIAKRKLMAELISLKDDTEYQANLAFQNEIYQTHPYAKPSSGTLESIVKVRREDLVAIHQKYFTPARAVLVVVGRIQPDQVASWVEKFFSGWHGLPFVHETFPRLKLPSKPKELKISVEKEQLSILYGHLGIRRSNPDYHKLLALDHILGCGEGFTDRLSKKIRDELGLCYHISASVTNNAGYEPGTFCASLATSPEHYHVAMENLQREIHILQNERVTEEELLRVRNYLIQKLISLLETNDALATYYLKCHCYQLGFDYLQRLPEIWHTITAEHIQDMAQRYLHPHVAITAVAGPIAGLV